MHLFLHLVYVRYIKRKFTNTNTSIVVFCITYTTETFSFSFLYYCYSQFSYIFSSTNIIQLCDIKGEMRLKNAK